MPGSFRGVLYELHLSWNSLIRRYKIGETIWWICYNLDFFISWKKILNNSLTETFFSKVDMPGSFRGVLYELHLSWNLSSKTIRHFSVDKWQLHFTDDTTNAWTLTNNFSVRWNNWSWHFYTWMVVSIFDLLTQNCRKLFENVWYIGKMRASFKICL